VEREPSRAEGTVVNTETVMGTATGVVISHDANLLVENGAYIKGMGTAITGLSETERYNKS